MITKIFLSIIVLSSCSFADSLPAFKDDAAADSWLKQNSADFKGSSARMEKRGGYVYVSVDKISSFLGFRYNDEGKLCIEIPNNTEGTKRFVHLLQHRCSAGHALRYKLLEDSAADGKIQDSKKFIDEYLSIYWESMIDFESYLGDLKKLVGDLPTDGLQYYPFQIEKADELLKKNPEIEKFILARFESLTLKKPNKAVDAIR